MLLMEVQAAAYREGMEIGAPPQREEAGMERDRLVEHTGLLPDIADRLPDHPAVTGPDQNRRIVNGVLGVLPGLKYVPVDETVVGGDRKPALTPASVQEA